MAAVDRVTVAEFFPLESTNLEVASTMFPDESNTLDLEKARAFWRSAKEDYKAYLASNDKKVLAKYRRENLTPLTLAVTAGLSLRGSRLVGRIGLDSNLPVGSGLGSSASMCSAVLGLILSLDKRVGTNDLNVHSFEVEQILNGKPSGADNSAVVYGGWLRFQRESGDNLHVEKLDALEQSANWWLVDGGKPEETTLDLIAKVLDLASTNKSLVDKLIHRDRTVTESVQKQLKLGGLKPDFLEESQAVLEDFGVIGGRGRELIEAIKSGGGYAKVSGAGGVKSGVGSILAYHEEEGKMGELANKYNFSYSKLKLGGRGWRIEE